MAIEKIFNGAVLVSPGSYSVIKNVAVGGQASIATGKVAIIGEAEEGLPSEIVAFAPSALSELIAEYKSGPIVDAAIKLVSPSNDSRVTNGASEIYVVKTNKSTKASLTLPSFGTITSKMFGVNGNRVHFRVERIAGTKVKVTTGDITKITTGATLSIRVNGGAVQTVTTEGEITSPEALVEALATISELKCTVEGKTVVIEVNTEAKAGAGDSLEIIDGTMLEEAGLKTGLFVPVLEEKARIIVSKDDHVEDTDDNGGNVGGVIALELGINDTTATVSIADGQLVVTAASLEGFTVDLDQFPTLDALATFLNGIENVTCVIPEEVNPGMNPLLLDRVTDVGAASATHRPCRLKADATAVKSALQMSILVDVELEDQCGLAPACSGNLKGGTRGATTNDDVAMALTKLEGVEDVSIIVPLFSQDATDDIAEDKRHTDVASDYTIEAILTMCQTHVVTMSQIKNRKERCMKAGFRGTFSECKKMAKKLNNGRTTLVIQDCQTVNGNNDVVWAQPFITASCIAGLQAGSPIGESATFKLLNLNGIKHVGKQGVKITDLKEEFIPSKKGDQAIKAGIMPLEIPTTGGVRAICDQSTYGKDGDFKENRPGVTSACDFISKTLRVNLENKYLGTRINSNTVNAVTTDVEVLMRGLKGQGAIVGDSTNDNLGFKNLKVKVDGSVIYVNVTVTPVQSVDFILATIEIDTIKQ